MARLVVGVEPLASADRETLARAVGPTIQRYLVGDLGDLGDLGDGRAAGASPRVMPVRQ
jgi:hypothetical protein